MENDIEHHQISKDNNARARKYDHSTHQGLQNLLAIAGAFLINLPIKEKELRKESGLLGRKNGRMAWLAYSGKAVWTIGSPKILANSHYIFQFLAGYRNFISFVKKK